MFYFWLSLASSTTLLVLGAILSVIPREGKNGIGRAMALNGGGVFLSVLMPLVGMQAFAVLIVGTVCWVANLRPRWFIVSSVVATLAVYTWMAVENRWHWEERQKDYPVESLTDRLAYEDRPHKESGSADSPLLSDFEDHLTKKSNDYWVWTRRRSLELLHAGMVEQFVESPGFGIGRMAMMRPGPYRTHANKADPIEQAFLAAPLPDQSPADVQLTTGVNFLSVHRDNALDFLNPIDFGLVHDRDHVVGFLPHQFHYRPQAPEHWILLRLDLVSLLKSSEPVAYLSRNFPRMEEMSNAPTRPLDTFEQQALAKLRRGEDLVASEQGDRMRLLGSLRAAQQCLECHNARRGELLGAFSYRLSAQKPSRHPADS
jgi:Protein of unknown function (DUF3365)